MERKIWTPGGDVVVGDTGGGPASASPPPPPPRTSAAGEHGAEMSEEELRAAIEQLASVPVAELVLNQAVSFAGIGTLQDVEPLTRLGGRLKEHVDTRIPDATPAIEPLLQQSAVTLIQVASVHLVPDPAHLAEARLAIDAIGAIVEEAGDNLGAARGELESVLQELRLRFVEATKAAPEGPS